MGRKPILLLEKTRRDVIREANTYLIVNNKGWIPKIRMFLREGERRGRRNGEGWSCKGR